MNDTVIIVYNDEAGERCGDVRRALESVLKESYLASLQDDMSIRYLPRGR
jgi:hypothetical protein